MYSPSTIDINKAIQKLCLFIGTVVFIDFVGQGADFFTNKLLYGIVFVALFALGSHWVLLSMSSVPLRNTVIESGIYLLIGVLRSLLVVVFLQYMNIITTMAEVRLTFFVFISYYIVTRVNSKGEEYWKKSSQLSTVLARYVQPENYEQYLDTEPNTNHEETEEVEEGADEETATTRRQTESRTINLSLFDEPLVELPVGESLVTQISFLLSFVFVGLAIIVAIVFFGLNFAVFFNLVSISVGQYLLPIAISISLSLLTVVLFSGVVVKRFYEEGLLDVIKRFVFVSTLFNIPSIVVLVGILSTFVLFTEHSALAWSRVVIVGTLLLIKIKLF